MSNSIAQNQVSAAETARKRKGRRGKVIVFGLWCKDCGICMEFCPKGVFAFNADDELIVAKPEACTACHWCDTHCPDMAIVVKPIE